MSTQATGLSDSQKAALFAEARKIKAEGLRKFFLTLGFPAVLAEAEDIIFCGCFNESASTSVDDADLPGAVTYGDRGIRHFLVEAAADATAPEVGRTHLYFQTEVRLVGQPD